MSMNCVNKKPSTYRDEAVPWLHYLSKAALVDCVIDLLRGQSECCDEPVSIATAKERLEPVLNMRGDLMPSEAKEFCAMVAAKRRGAT